MFCADNCLFLSSATFVETSIVQIDSGADFIEAFKHGEQADYHQLRTHGDRKLVRLLWVYDVNFSWTLKKMVERGYIQKVIDHLPDQEGVDVGVKRMWKYIEEKCAAEDVI